MLFFSHFWDQHLHQLDFSLFNRHLIVHLKKVANWLSIQRKRKIYCQFEERVNQHPVTFHQTSVAQKKRRTLEGERVLREFSFLFLRERLGE